jgi:creatinine amidohydrolase
LNASPFPSYRDRYLPAFSVSRIQSLSDREWAPVIIGTGAIEQHGPHLPVAVDSFLGEVGISRIMAGLPPEVSCYVGPPITIGKSNEHSGFPGTLVISKATLRSQVLAIALQLKRWGFRHLLIHNSHGGNAAVLVYTMNEIRADFGLSIRFTSSGVAPPVSNQEAAYGFHANEIETALMYANAGAFCKPAAALCHYPARIGDPGELRPENAPATFAWATQDISPSGIMGDAKAGTAENGRQWLDEAAAGLIGFVARSSVANKEAYFNAIRRPA